MLAPIVKACTILWGLNEACCDWEVNVSSFSAGNLRHKNVTAGCRVNQYGSRGSRLKAGGKERERDGTTGEEGNDSGKGWRKE